MLLATPVLRYAVLTKPATTPTTTSTDQVTGSATVVTIGTTAVGRLNASSTAEEAARLTTTVKELIAQFDTGGDWADRGPAAGGSGGGGAAGQSIAGDGKLDSGEMPSLWRTRLELEEAAMLGQHPLAFTAAWDAFCFGLGTLFVGLLLGGWGEPQEV